MQGYLWDGSVSTIVRAATLRSTCYPTQSQYTDRGLSGVPIFKSTWGRYHGGRRPSSDDSFHSPAVIPPSALDKPSITKRYHRRWTYNHTSPRLLPTMVTLHFTRFVEYRRWNDGWTVKTVDTWQSSASMIPDPGVSIGVPIFKSTWSINWGANF